MVFYWLYVLALDPFICSVLPSMGEPLLVALQASDLENYVLGEELSLCVSL